MRDNKKNNEYFIDLINLYNNEVLRLEHDDFKRSVKNWNAYFGALAYYKKELLALLYSSGSSKNTLVQYFIESLHNFVKEYDEGAGIANIIDYLSLAVLFDEHKSEFMEDIELLLEKYSDLADNELVQTDDFISILFHYLLTGEVRAFNAYYEYLNMIENDFESVQEAQGFWYYDHSDAPWYNSHKYDNRGYVGYWSFDTAALCKMRGILDERLKELDYFPYDLLVQEV